MLLKTKHLDTTRACRVNTRIGFNFYRTLTSVREEQVVFPGRMSDEYGINIGSLNVEVTTDSEECRAWFQRGIMWAAGFHREEAVRCFTKATEIDNSCVLAHWGVALAQGPDYNFHEGAGYYVVAAQEKGYPSLKVAVDHLNTALSMLDKSGDKYPAREHALVKALTIRYEFPITPSTPSLSVAYSEEMESLSKRFQDDVLVNICFVESLMCLAPWKLYNPDRSINDTAKRVIPALHHTYSLEKTNLWTCHLMMHLNEMGPRKDFNWEAADTLRNCGLDVGHLPHMATHLDFQVGKYKEAIKYNQIGIAADEIVLAKYPESSSIYYGYYLHNVEFCTWAAMYGGNKKIATETVAKMGEALKEDLLRQPMMDQELEAFLATEIMVLVRFGLWDDILKLELKPDQNLYVAYTLFLDMHVV